MFVRRGGWHHLWQVIKKLLGKMALPISGFPPQAGCQLSYHFIEVAGDVLKLRQRPKRGFEQQLQAVPERRVGEQAGWRILLAVAPGSKLEGGRP